MENTSGQGKALRLAAYLLIAHFLVVVALAFLAKGAPDYSHLVLALALLIGATVALFSPRRRGWLAVLAYAIVVVSRHAIGLWATWNNSAVPMGMKVTALVILVLFDSLVIAALVLVFKPTNFAAFKSPLPETATSVGVGPKA